MLWVGLVIVLAAYCGVVLLARERTWPQALRWLFSSKAHYLLFGLGLGILIPAERAGMFRPVLRTLIVFLATWTGFLLGTTLDVRVLRGTSSKLLWTVLLRTAIVFVLVYVIFLVLSPVSAVGRHHSSAPGSAALAFAAVACVGLPWVAVPVARSIKSPSSVARQLRLMSLLSGAVGLLVASAAIYASTTLHGEVWGGGAHWPAWLRQLVLSCIIGGFVGMGADVLSRDESDVRCTALLLFAALALGGGLSWAYGLLPPLVGAAAGFWLINATLRRVDILEFTEQSTDLFSGLLLVSVGAAMGFARGATASLVLLVVLGGVALFAVRLLGDLVGSNIGARLARLPGDRPTWLFGVALLPQGGLTVAVAITVKQGLPDAWFAVVLASVLLTQAFCPYLLAQSLRSAQGAPKERTPTPAP